MGAAAVIGTQDVNMAALPATPNKHKNSRLVGLVKVFISFFGCLLIYLRRLAYPSLLPVACATAAFGIDCFLSFSVIRHKCGRWWLGLVIRRAIGGQCLFVPDNGPGLGKRDNCGMPDDSAHAASLHAGRVGR